MFVHQHERDNYCTDPREWDKIRHFLPTDEKIWSPFYCDGKMKEYFAEMGFDIIHMNEDFFLNNHGDIVVDNPPFSRYRQVCERLFALQKPFILIGLYQTLGTKWFQEMFKDDLQLIIPHSRIKFYHHTNKKLTNYTPPFGTLFYCWRMNLPKDINWV